MNAATKLVLQHAVTAVVAGAGATAATVAVVSGTHESITLAVGDTLVPRFSIKTDSVLRAPGSGRIVVSKCGQSAIYLRNYQGLVQRSADTVDVTVSCAPAVASVDVCFVNGDSAAKYGVTGDVSPDTAAWPAGLKATLQCGDTLQLQLDPTKLQPAIQRRSIMFAPRPVQSSSELFQR